MNYVEIRDCSGRLVCKIINDTVVQIKVKDVTTELTISPEMKIVVKK